MITLIYQVADVAGLPAMLATLSVFFLYLINRKYQGSENWPSARGEIYSAAFVNGRQRTFVDILYWYSVNGKTHPGKKEISTRFNEYEEVSKKYHRGKVVSVYYKPNNPSISVLTPVVFSLRWTWIGSFVFWLLFEFLFYLRLTSH